MAENDPDDFDEDYVGNNDNYAEYMIELTNIEVLLLGKTEKALIVSVNDEKHFIGQSIVDNLDEMLKLCNNRRSRDKSKKVILSVPRWLASTR